MSIALESDPGLRGGRRFGSCAAAPVGRSSSSVGRESDGSAAAAQWEWDGEEVEGGDGEVQSSYRGPLDSMDALHEALPFRKSVSKFYNGKSGSFAKLTDAMIPSPPVKGFPKPENQSPRKRKGLLPFSLKWSKAHNNEVYPEDDVVDSPTSCRRATLSPAATSSSGSNSGSDEEPQKLPLRRRPHRRPGNGTDVFASPPAARPPQLVTAHARSRSMLDLQDVGESTAMVSPRDKRRKNRR